MNYEACANFKRVRIFKTLIGNIKQRYFNSAWEIWVPAVVRTQSVTLVRLHKVKTSIDTSIKANSLPTAFAILSLSFFARAIYFEGRLTYRVVIWSSHFRMPAVFFIVQKKTPLSYVIFFYLTKFSDSCDEIDSTEISQFLGKLMEHSW